MVDCVHKLFILLNTLFYCINVKLICMVVLYEHSCLKIGVRNQITFPHFSTKTYVVGTQKYSLNETVLLSTLRRFF